MNVSQLQNGPLLGQYFLGHRFYKDKSSWIRIDGLRLGIKNESSSGVAGNIIGLFDRIISRSDVAIVSFDWISRQFFVSGSYDLDDESDTVQNYGFSTFVLQSRAMYAGAPTPIVSGKTSAPQQIQPCNATRIRSCFNVQ